MSELTSCNYCSLKAIKARARKEHQRVEVRPAKWGKYYCGGVDVFIDGKFEAWFMELPNQCCC